MRVGSSSTGTAFFDTCAATIFAVKDKISPGFV
jgi:hypothetical protein